FRHEAHAGLHNDGCIRLRRFARELERVTTEIADAVEDFRCHVIVREDDRVLGALHLVDGADQRRIRRPLDRRYDVLHAFIKRGGFGGDFRRVGEAPALGGVERAPSAVDRTGIAAAFAAGKRRIDYPGHVWPPRARMALMLSRSIYRVENKAEKTLGPTLMLQMSITYGRTILPGIPPCKRKATCPSLAR